SVVPLIGDGGFLQQLSKLSLNTLQTFKIASGESLDVRLPKFVESFVHRSGDRSVLFFHGLRNMRPADQVPTRRGRAINRTAPPVAERAAVSGSGGVSQRGAGS